MSVGNTIRYYLQRYPVKTQRFLEIFPGFFSWSLILFPFWGSLVIPNVVAYYVIAFAVYWLYRSLTLSVLAVIAHLKIQASIRFDWVGDLKKNYPDKWQTIHHCIVIPTYKEPLTTLERTLEALSRQTFPTKNIHIMLSFEDREGAAAREKAEVLKRKFHKRFGNLWTTYHPDISGEVKGKSSNTAWGAKQAKQYLVDEQKISIESITISSEDADALFHPSYFATVTQEFLSTPKPFNVIWQGSVVFYNNIWRVPAPVRVLASMFSVIQMHMLMRRDRLINFSTYTTTLKHIHEIGYWDTDVIPEDYRLFFKSYFAKKGDFEVHPIFLPIYADAAESNGWWQTLFNQYEQLKRWAWGVSDDAYIIKHYLMAKDAPFWDKSVRVLKTMEDHFLWPVNWFAVTISAFLPPLLNESFNRTILGKTLPQVTSTLLTLSLVALVVIFVIDALNRPPRPNRRNPFSYIVQPLEFFLFPILGFFFSALPGIDAHTRLMLGKYIEYKVTEKI
ncbi:glycosyltransferase family 2 protein [Candidatus Woesebacteria bacterium]|nr:glycosyltransferase family 2 protein [Candidatus Woesebacteria bacterium]